MYDTVKIIVYEFLFDVFSTRSFQPLNFQYNINIIIIIIINEVKMQTNHLFFSNLPNIERELTQGT